MLYKKKKDVDHKKVAEVKKMKKSPSSFKRVPAVLGLADFFTKFLSDFGKPSEPLYQLLKKEKNFFWTKECEDAMQVLKGKLLSAPILGYSKNCGY